MTSNDYPRRAQFRRLASDFMGEVALGTMPGHKAVNKFGIAPSGIQTTVTDVWDRANATPTQQIWLAPTAARVHAIDSTSAEDAPGQDGATSLVVYGLPDWDTAETNETIALNGTGSVNTAGSYVIIHRMKCIAQASTVNPGANVGTITATAAVDATVTATILPSNGQTEMAIYGVPSTQKALLYSWYGQIDKTSGQTAASDFILRVNENPNVQTVAFLRKADISVQSTGANSVTRYHDVPQLFPGPCIMKVQGMASGSDIDGEAGFDLVLVTND